MWPVARPPAVASPTRAQGALRCGEGGELRGAAQRGRCAGEEDRAPAAREHVPRRLATEEEARVAGEAPHLLEHLRGRFGDRRAEIGPGIENRHLDRAALLDAVEEL